MLRAFSITLIYLNLALLLATTPVYSQQPTVIQDFNRFDPLLVENKDGPFILALDHSYRTRIAHSKIPDPSQIIEEINRSHWQKIVAAEITEPGYYLSLDILHNPGANAMDVIRYGTLRVDEQVYKLVQGQLQTLIRTGAIGSLTPTRLEPGLNIFVTVTNNSTKGNFDRSWLKFYDPVTFTKTKDLERTFAAFFAGFVLLSIIFSFWLCVIYRKIFLVSYAFYLISLSALVFMWNGTILEFDRLSFAWACGSTGIFLLLFGRNFLTHKGHRFSQMTNVLITIQLPLLIFFIVRKEVGWTGLLPCTSVLFFIFLCATSRRIERSTLWLLLIGSGTVAASGISNAANFYFRWHIAFADSLVILSTAVEILCFSLAMIQKSHSSEDKAQKESQHAFKQLQKVVYPHQIDRIRQGESLEQTMPTAAGQACVLSFDIIGSSKIKHIKAKEFFRKVFLNCNEIMSEGYDGSTMRANAYRIKEMGDGFLCSIGYPFQSMTDNAANDAIILARRFAQVLHEQSSILHLDQPVTCGIGIALDSLSGFYPEGGTKEYDLFGRALILATRYEAMRKNLFEAEKDRSVVIVQEIVYLSLDPELREGFQCLDLQQRGIPVRDDPAATQLFYEFLQPAPHNRKQLPAAS